MRVLHIIPSAFEYFQDIKEEAFAIAEEIEALQDHEKEPIQSQAVTLQYGAPTKREKEVVQQVAPSKQYTGEARIPEVVNQFSEYDIVHLHTPFMGGAGQLKKWKESNPEQPFVITYYRDVLLPDFFAYIFKFYNGYYLPKLFKLADVVTCFFLDDFLDSHGKNYLDKPEKLISLLNKEEIPEDLTPDDNEVKLYARKSSAFKLLQIYKALLRR